MQSMSSSALAPRSCYVELDGLRYDICKDTCDIDGYSAHADRLGERRFMIGGKGEAKEIRFVHGERPRRRCPNRCMIGHRESDGVKPSLRGESVADLGG